MNHKSEFRRWWHRFCRTFFPAKEQGSGISWGLVLVFVAPVGAQIIASSFNIWFTFRHIAPILTPEQLRWHLAAVLVYNAIAYPAAIVSWAWALWPLNQPLLARQKGETVPEIQLARAQRRCINLPWHFTAFVGAAWLGSIPTLLTALAWVPGKLDPQLFIHLPISILIAMSIALTHGFFVVEILSQKRLFPLLFRNSRPADTEGTLALSLTSRGLMWAVSACVCPLASVLLLMIPARTQEELLALAIPVAGVGVCFALFTAWMLGRWIAAPVRDLRRAARAIAEGNLDVEVDMLRADEFGPLIDEFNDMILQLRDTKRLQETFGRHVGQQAARQILSCDDQMGGVEQQLTVLFADLRAFTARCSEIAPRDVVRTLNMVFGEMVQVIESKEGMVNKFLGDGLMALFGVGDTFESDHAYRAFAAAQTILARLDELNHRLILDGIRPVSIGIGIHTGTAVVGSIGAPNRMEFTAIGDAVNVASRVEALTKELCVPLLITEATRRLLPQDSPLQEFPPQFVRGKRHPLKVFTLVSGLSRASA